MWLEANAQGREYEQMNLERCWGRTGTGLGRPVRTLTFTEVGGSYGVFTVTQSDLYLKRIDPALLFFQVGKQAQRRRRTCLRSLDGSVVELGFEFLSSTSLPCTLGSNRL